MGTLTSIVTQIAIGAVLLVALISYVRWVYEDHFGDPTPVVMPFHIAGKPEAEAKVLAEALPRALLSRLPALKRDLQATIQELQVGTDTRVPPRSDAAGLRPQNVVETPDIQLPVSAWDPADLRIKIGETDISGVVNWIIRRIADDISLNVSIVFEKDASDKEKAFISGNSSGLRTPLVFSVITEPRMQDITRAVALALMQAQAAKKIPNVAYLTADEFGALLETFSDLARLKRNQVIANVAVTDYQAVLQHITPIADRLVNWRELQRWAAEVAIAADRIPAARQYLQNGIHAPGNDSTREALEERLAGLGAAKLPLAIDVDAAQIRKLLGIPDTAMPAGISVGIVGGIADPLKLEGAAVTFLGQSKASKPNSMSQYHESLIRAISMVAPTAKFILNGDAVRHGDGGFSYSDILKATSELAEHKPDVVLIPYGPLDDAAAIAPVLAELAKSSVVVLPAGNEGKAELPFSKKRDIQRMLLIAAATDMAGKREAYSNWGDAALWTPGAIAPDPAQKGPVMRGTSSASAYLAGIAARILASSQGLKPDALAVLLRETSIKPTDGAERMVNVTAALAKLPAKRNP